MTLHDSKKDSPPDVTMSVDFDPCVMFFSDCLAYVLYKGQTGRKVGAL